MGLYAAWVLYSAKREKHRRACLIEVNNKLSAADKKEKLLAN